MESVFSWVYIGVAVLVLFGASIFVAYAIEAYLSR